jgi:nicotinamidase-related amidase/RimJ/RimL family protein N-acetyltransferase
MTNDVKRALVVIDVQNDYFNEKLPIEFPPAETSLTNIGKAMDEAALAGIPVVVVQNILPEGSPIMAKGSHGAELHPAIGSRPRDHFLTKNLPSAFADTGLADWLNGRSIDAITIVGYMTHNCDFSTVTHAMHIGLKVELLSDATGSVPYENRAGSATAEEIHRVMTVVMQSRFAAVMSTQEWITAINSGAEPERDNIYASNLRARKWINEGGDIIDLLPMGEADINAIKCWPPYSGVFEQMDYALRENGWLDEAGSLSNVRMYVCKTGETLAGFCMLFEDGMNGAEFRIAIHPQFTGRGLGKKITLAILHESFKRLALKNLHLVVRKTNAPARRLYNSVGFKEVGETFLNIQGQPVDFIKMKISNNERWRG